MTTPTNYGKLAVSLNTFNSHTSGASSKHEATTITLDPAVTIDGYSASNVKSAINKLNSYIATVASTAPSDASTSAKGIVKLDGDLSGTALLPTVTRVTGNSSTTSVELDQVNLYFTDTAGTAHKIGFKSSNPVGNPGTLTIQGQQARLNLFSVVNGGDVTIIGGLKNTLSASSRNGKVFVKTQTGDVIVAKETGVTANILSLFNDVSSTDYPSSVDKTIYVRDASTDPTALPLSGSILYSNGGFLKVKHGNGDNFAIGDHPERWSANIGIASGFSSGLICDAKRIATTTLEQTISSLSFNENDGVMIVSVDMVGLCNTPVFGFAGYKFVSTLKINAGTISTISTTFLHSSESGDAVNWNAPDVTSNSPYLVEVVTGVSPDTYSISWFANVAYSYIEN